MPGFYDYDDLLNIKDKGISDSFMLFKGIAFTTGTTIKDDTDFLNIMDNIYCFDARMKTDNDITKREKAFFFEYFSRLYPYRFKLFNRFDETFDQGFMFSYIKCNGLCNRIIKSSSDLTKYLVYLLLHHTNGLGEVDNTTYQLMYMDLTCKYKVVSNIYDEFEIIRPLEYYEVLSYVCGFTKDPEVLEKVHNFMTDIEKDIIKIQCSNAPTDSIIIYKIPMKEIKREDT